MNNIWRFTGPPENWLTAIALNKWAVNEKNKSLWETKIRPGDIALFHSTKKSGFAIDTTSSIIGFGYIGEGHYRKDEFWWVQEVQDHKNHWPYVIPFREIYLYSSTETIDSSAPIERKSPDQVRQDIRILTSSAIPIRELNRKAKEINPDSPDFPVNGSVSRVNEIYENILFSQDKDLLARDYPQETDLLDRRLSETFDEKFSGFTKEKLLTDAQNFSNAQDASHTTSFGPKKVRIESRAQKRRVAAIEEYTCQVCNFKCEYMNSKGKKGWIIHVDHIVDKADGGNEDLKNLWVLCPNCHEKKTRGVIEINPETKEVRENETVMQIRDNHLNS